MSEVYEVTTQVPQESSASTRHVSGHGTIIIIWVARCVFAAIFVVAWQVVATKKVINPLFIGVPSEIAKYFWDGLFVNHSMVIDLAWTMAGTAAAFAIGSVLGIVTGLIFSAYAHVEKFAEPFMSALNALPRIALAPLFLLWFGIGIASKIALGASLTFFIVLSSTTAGVRSVDQDHEVLAQTLGASPGQVFFKITLPNAVPIIFSGLRLGLIYALIGDVAGEIIAAQHGLGEKLTYLAGTFQTDGVFAILILLAIVGGSVTGVMSAIEARLLRWR